MARKQRATASTSPLTAKDHTSIVNLVMENPQHFARALGVQELQRQTSQFTTARVLRALLAMPQLAAGSRRKIEAALKSATATENAKIRVSAAKRKTLDRVLAQTRGVPTARKKIAVLRRLLDDPTIAGEEGIAIGLRFAIQLLEDGAATIYSSKHPFYRQITVPGAVRGEAAPGGVEGPPGSGGGGSEGGSGGNGKGAGDHSDDVGQADLEGGIGGSFQGWLIAGDLGAEVGGALGAIGSSTESVGRKFVNWLFG